MSLHRFYNPNPARSRVGDCTVRAICKATGQDWNRTFAALAAYGLACKDMPSANAVWGKYLYEQGFRRHLIDDDKFDYTVEDFCRDHPNFLAHFIWEDFLTPFLTSFDTPKE